jgi:hypothetical protein
MSALVYTALVYERTIYIYGVGSVLLVSAEVGNAKASKVQDK